MAKDKKDTRELNSDTPDWFKEWHMYHYFPFRQEFKFYKALQWVILVAILATLIQRICG